MPYEEKTIVCSDCDQEFVHSAEDQARYAERGFTNDPKRCRECREKRKVRGSRGPDGRAEREVTEVTCAECGTLTTVPFKPTKDRPVYCRDCFQAKRE